MSYIVITKIVNLMHLKTIKYTYIYALKTGKICLKIFSHFSKICKKKLLKFNYYSYFFLLILQLNKEINVNKNNTRTYARRMLVNGSHQTKNDCLTIFVILYVRVDISKLI